MTCTRDIICHIQSQEGNVTYLETALDLFLVRVKSPEYRPCQKLYLLINPQCTCIAKVTGVVPCVRVCLRAPLICHHATESQKRGVNGFSTMQEQFETLW